MKNSGKITGVFGPIILYYLLSNVLICLFAFLFGVTKETYAVRYTMLQTFATALILPVLLSMLAKDDRMNTVFSQRMRNAYGEVERGARWRNGLVCLALGAVIGLVFNLVLTGSGLAHYSSGYQEVSTYFWSGPVAFEVIGLGIVSPIAEELLYRGLVYGRLCDWIGRPKAWILSALLFGVLHFNLVQFVYASLLGLLFVLMFEKTHHLSGAVLGHIGANLAIVILTNL